MAAKLHFLEAPPGPELRQLVLGNYLSISHASIGRTMWLVPTELAANEIREQIVKSGKTILSPNVFGLPSLVSALNPTPVQATLFRRRTTLEHVVRSLNAKEQLAHFGRVAGTRGFRDGAMEMIDELESAAVLPEAFRKALPRKNSPKLNDCQILFREFRKEFKESTSLADIVARFDSSASNRFANLQSVFVSGFASFTTAESSLLTWLVAQVADLWIALPNLESPSEFAEFVGQTSEMLKDRFGEAESRVSGTVLHHPPALSHLLAELFQPKRRPSENSLGLSLIEAPGDVGEARMVARRIRKLIANGAQPDDIIVTARDLTHSYRVLEEVFGDYGIPTDVADEEPLAHVPAVRTLLNALRLHDEDFPFAGVSALLRSNYLQPVWPEAENEMPMKAEGLLRMLGEPRSRAAYLKAVDMWHRSPPPALEDEQAEESSRNRKTRLAGECEPFFQRFFNAWETLPATATPKRFVECALRFSEELGIANVAQGDYRDARALETLWAAMAPRGTKSITREQFMRSLSTAAAAESLSLWTGMKNRVRIVPAEEARHLACDYLFVLGLGEGSFPKLSASGSLLDDGDRRELRRWGLPLPDPSIRLASEQLLFLELIGQVRQELILSYPALDDKGQPMLPGSFLRMVRDCFVEGTLIPERQSMLIEGFTTQQPYSAAELRVQFAVTRSGRRNAAWTSPVLPNDLCEHLHWASDMADERFRTKDFGRYDGWTDGKRTVEHVEKRFGVDRVFSPTSLETYVACPFRFLMEHVLRLGELEEPAEEVEQTRRGSAYHRALSRLHSHLNEHDPTIPQRKLPDLVSERLCQEMNVAIQEYIDRAPSDASKKLWELEGKRLHRSVVRYQPHWDDFLDPWRNKSTAPIPRHLEANFGLPPAPNEKPITHLTIDVDGVEVRIGGRIDRVDVAELEDGLGFWVIDYKTGRASNYTGPALAGMEKLQLSLYALAIQRVFYPGQNARPLGLAYWLVTDTGAKTVMPSRNALQWLEDPEAWSNFRVQLEHWVAKLVGRIRLGQFPLAPRSEHCTDICAYAQMCRISQSRSVGKEFDLKLPGKDE